MKRPTAMQREHIPNFPPSCHQTHRKIAFYQLKNQRRLEPELGPALPAKRMDYYFVAPFTFYAILVDFVRKCSLAAAERIFYGQWIWGYIPKPTTTTDPDQRSEHESVAVDDQFIMTSDSSHATEPKNHEKLPLDDQQHADSDISSDLEAPYSNISGAWHFGWRFVNPLSVLLGTRHFEDLLEDGSSKKMYTMTGSEKEWRLLTAMSLAFVFTLAVDGLAIGTCLVVKGIQKVAGVVRENYGEGNGRIWVVEGPVGGR
ncbi:hypothetical protein CBER1_08629 [Cercospora berteroae]|uniref:Uncharacterized protein n=1 Tax=Cercospora berteroae TaxID=357750 RepID=A0A2S6BV37_9PEZI|nr:hypothetical protein CBER1_08629 [Cercospora berteroae]